MATDGKDFKIIKAMTTRPGKDIITDNTTMFDTKQLFTINDIPNVNYLTFGYSKTKKHE